MQPTGDQFDRLQQFVRRIQLVSGAIAIGVALVSFATLPFNIDTQDDRVTPVMGAVALAIAIHAGLMIRLAIWFRSHPSNPNRGSMSDHADRWPPTPRRTRPGPGFARLFMPTFLLPLAIWVLMGPWILAGVFNDTDVSTVQAALLLLFVVYGSLAGGIPMVIVLATVELIARGLYRLVFRRDPGGIGQIAGAATIVYLVALVVIGSRAVDIQPEYQTRQVDQAWLGFEVLVGLSGDYEVTNPSMLWLFRVMFALVVIVIAVIAVLARRSGRSDVPHELDTSHR